MTLTFQKITSIWIGLCIVLLGGWVMNLVKLIASGDLHFNAGMTLARVVGIFIVPLGSVLGFF
ncbi:hypothetical protein DRY79_14095 [Salmonella enterica subsp. enterica serovar Montevideo]|nr:hypothetical protein [Salmonella enterica subsp. enterica serovar Montevideo]